MSASHNSPRNERIINSDWSVKEQELESAKGHRRRIMTIREMVRPETLLGCWFRN